MISKMKYSIRYIFTIISCLFLVGCIENDIPYPRIQADFLSFDVTDAQSTAIDDLTRTVTIKLNEMADISNVDVTNYTLTEGASIVGNDIKGGINLTDPVIVTLKLYQEYEWTIVATQEIERYFTISNQIGASIIDVPARRIIAYVPTGTDLSKIVVNSIKLGSKTAVMDPNMENQTVDFSEPKEVSVIEHGRISKWTIYIKTTESSVTTERVDAWTNVAWLYGSAEVGKNNGFEYRSIDSQQWIKLPSEWVAHDGGSFVGRLIHLDNNSTYVVRAYSDEERGVEITFTTGSVAGVPNSSFDFWHQSGKVWNPWAENEVSFWDTGNKGATTLGQSNSVPSDELPVGLTGKSAKLETKFVGIASIGKLAAGNMFSGTYVRTDGTNGILSFGREFTERPTKMTGYYKYNCELISHTSSEMAHMKNQPDTASIYIALADWSEPLEIRTNPNNRQLFDSNAPEIIAYGKLEAGASVEEYTRFEIELEYRDTQRKPKYILIVASASKYGDFFTGGNGSILYVDDFQLEYDY